jgi:hypothetical protein
MKKLSVYVSASLAVLSFAGCAMIQVSEDYDRRAPFANYKTFGWMPKPDKMPLDARAAIERNPLLGKRIEEITGRILADKGMTLSADDPNILINAYVGFKERVDIAGWGYFYGPRWGYFWPHLGPYDEYVYTEGTLVLDFVDAKTKEMVWRGVADEALRDYGASSRNFSDKELWKILKKVLSQYPPSRFSYRS